jgi:hypothetical protein
MIAVVVEAIIDNHSRPGVEAILFYDATER